MLTAIACLGIFLLLAALMAAGRVSALLAIPAMALAVALVARVPGPDILQIVVQDGAVKFGDVMVATMVGAVLAQIMTKFGIGTLIVRWAAEFSGDSPFIVGVVLLLVTALLFSSMGGLGAVIAVGSVVLPVLISVGLSPVVAGALLVLGISLGGMFNLGNWKFFMDVLLVSQEDIKAFVLLLAPVFTLVAVAFLFVQLEPNQQRRSWPFLAATALVGLAMVFAWYWRSLAGLPNLVLSPTALRTIAWVTALLLGISWIHRRLNPSTHVPSYALVTPIIPLAMVLLFNLQIIPALGLGILHGVLSTWRPGHINIATKATFEGISTVVPVLVLLMGIGMVVKAMMHPAVSVALEPTLRAIVPTNPVAYVVVFGLLAPLSLYRGPLNRFGMGSGLAGLLLGIKVLPNSAIFGLFESVGQIQGVCDPTNTANVWVAGYVGTSPTRLMLKTLPWVWAVSIAGLAISAYKYLGGSFAFSIWGAAA